MVSQLDDLLFPCSVAFQRFQRGTTYYRQVITREVVLGQQFTNFHLDQFEQLFVVYHVALVHEHDHVRDTNLATQQDVLTSLRHRAVSRGYYQDRAVHLGSTGDHVLNVVGVTRAIYVGVVTDRGVVFYVGGVDGDTTLTLFRCLVDLVEGESFTTEVLGQHVGDGGGQGGFTVVNVADGTHVNVRFITLKFFFRHDRPSKLTLSTRWQANHRTVYMMDLNQGDREDGAGRQVRLPNSP
ncbi:hypothetical protein D3C79_622620 [compost metagenome]